MRIWRFYRLLYRQSVGNTEFCRNVSISHSAQISYGRTLTKILNQKRVKSCVRVCVQLHGAVNFRKLEEKLFKVQLVINVKQIHKDKESRFTPIVYFSLLQIFHIKVFDSQSLVTEARIQT